MKALSLALASVATFALLGGAAFAQAPERPARGADMSREQAAQRAVTAFQRMDANKDGVFDAADREARKAQRHERRAERQGARFERLDADKNGSITRAEFDAAYDQQRTGVSERSGDGRRFGKRGHRGVRVAGFGGRGLFGADGNKPVTQAEFTAAALERFDRADTNKDATVTASEQREAFKALREQRRASGAPKQS